MSSAFITEQEALYDAKDFEKHRQKSMNPTIGYKRIKKDEPRWTFGTETIGKWHDRKLFDSMIH